MRDIKLYLKDILSSSNAIIAFIEGMEYEEFCKDDKTVSAVIKKLEIIGEAAKKIPHEITSANSGIPWKEMAGMRDILIHSYFGTEFEAVWLAAKTSVPELIPKIEKLLKEII
jgi:uncharacterized protein with HEPN domain